MNFRQWVIDEYKDRWHEPISDLANDLVYDDCWPADDSHDAGRRHLVHGHGASEGALECFEQAFAEYRAKNGSNGE